MFDLRLLGPFEAAIDGRPFKRFGTVRGKALLIYLAVENDRGHQRETLMGLLWPDMPSKSAQRNLRQSIYLLNKAVQDAGLAESPFVADRQRVQINPDFPLGVDVRRFLAALTARAPSSQQEAADLYRGPFLADFFLPDSEPFEAWAGARRAAYGRLALENLDHLAALHLAEGEYERAEATARRVLGLDDLYEPAHRVVMEILARSNRRQAAIAHYESFRQKLAEGLDVDPDETTEGLLEKIRSGELSNRESTVSRPTTVVLPRRQNLPAQTKPFIGRQVEIGQLDDFFDDPTIRLVTILGPGGMGKTHLAIEWARKQAKEPVDGRPRYVDGIHFVDLAPLDSADQIAPAMAESFALPLSGERRSPEQQLLDYLREKNLLLILDNFEQLIDASAFVNEILQAARSVRILVTSRERLHLTSEQVFALEGLTYPHDGMTDIEDVESFTAVQLFLRSAGRVQPGYQAERKDWQAIARICRAAGGMPLAIELAAAWIDLLPVDTLAEEMENHLDILEVDMRDLPERHRSIRAAFEATLRYLGAVEQQVFAQLSIFRGGFTWTAAKAILGQERNETSLRRILSLLHDKSLLTYDAHIERFAMHELLRQYGAEKLSSEEQADSKTVRDQHASYYIQLLSEQEVDLKGSRLIESLRLIDADLENMLTAWNWLAENGRRQQLAAAMDSLGLFLEIRGYLPSGRRVFGSLANGWRERLADQAISSEENGRDTRFVAKVLAWQAVFEFDQRKADSLLQGSLHLLNDQQLGRGVGSAERAFALYRLGAMLAYTQKGRAADCLREALAIYRELGDLWGTGFCLQTLGVVYFVLDLAAGRRYFQQASEVFERSGEQLGLVRSLARLVNTAALQHDELTLENTYRRFMALVADLEPSLVISNVLHVKEMYAFAKGRYMQAVGYRDESISYQEALGRETSTPKVFAAVNCLHADQFDKAREYLRETRREFEQAAVEDDFLLAFNLHISAMLALTENEFGTALRYMQEAMTTFRRSGDRLNLTGAQSLSAIACVEMGELAKARPGLVASLKVSLDQKAVIGLMEAYLGIALLLAHQGQLPWARENYEVMWRLPRFRNSAIYEAIAGQKIRALTASLSSRDLRAVKERIAGKDIWQHATAVLNELIAQGWEENPQYVTGG